MKTINYACALFLFLAAGSSTLAAGGGAIGTDEFLLKTVSPTRASIGLFYSNQPLEIEQNNTTRTLDVELEHAYAVIGYDILDWVTWYIKGGAVSFSRNGSDDETGTEFGTGFRSRLWVYEIGKTLDDISGRWTIDMSAEYTGHEVTFAETDMAWSEIYGSILWNWEFFEHDDDMDDPQSYRFVISVGAGYSAITGDADRNGTSEDFDANNRAGIVGGADVFFGRHLAIGGEVRAFDDVQGIGYVTYHF